MARIACTAIVLFALCCSNPAEAQQPCVDEGPWRVTLSAGLGVAAGATGALAISGALTADTKRDFDFVVGSLAGIGVTAGLSAVYGLYDGFTGCRMAGDSVAWSVPIVTFLVGSLIPVGVWAGSEEVTPEEQASPLTGSSMVGRSLVPRFRVRF